MLIEDRRIYAIWEGDGEFCRCDLSSPLMEQSLKKGMRLVKIIRTVKYDLTDWNLLPDNKIDCAVWKGEDASLCCSLSNPMMERSIEEGMILVKIIRNKTYNESAQIYNDMFNLGKYKPMDE